MIYGKHYIQYQAGVSYVTMCFYEEITFISKAEGWWGKFPRVLTVFCIKRRKKTNTRPYKNISYCSFGMAYTTKARPT